MSRRIFLFTVFAGLLLLMACKPEEGTQVFLESITAVKETQTAIIPATETPTISATATPSPTPLPPEKNVAPFKPVRVSASWVVDPPEKAVDGNAYNWWSAGGPAPQWIEIDLQGIYVICRIKIISEGPTGVASFWVYGRGPDRVNHLLHIFEGPKSNNQTMQYSPEVPWEDISTIRIEIPNGSGWVGFREVQIFSREEPEPLPALSDDQIPTYLTGVNPDQLESITADNAVFMEEIAMLGRGKINDLAWSPDGKTLAAASPIGIWLYELADVDTAPTLLTGHTREVLGVAFNTDGSEVFSGSQDGTVKIWDTSSGEIKRTIELWNDFSYEIGTQTRGPEVWSLEFSPDMKYLAAGSFDGTLHLWDLTTRKEKAVLEGHENQINLLAFSPDGDTLVSSSTDGGLFVWDVAAGIEEANLTVPSQLQSVAFSPDGKFLAYGGGGISPRLWDTSVGSPPIELSEPGSVLSLAFSPDNKTLASCSLDGARIRFYDIESGSTLIYKDDAGWNMKMAFSPDGKTLATYGWDGSLVLWDVETGEKKDIDHTHINSVTSVAINPEGTLLATGGQDGILRLWDIQMNHIKQTLTGHSMEITGLVFSSDGIHLSSSSMDKTVRLWDVESGKLLNIFEGHTFFIRGLAFNPDGSMIASGSFDKTVRLWDVNSGEARTILTGFDGEVQDVAFSPDGKWLVTAVQDGTIRVWDVETGVEVGVIGKHLSPGMSIAFSPDGSLIASGSGDHSLHVWNWKVANGVATGLNHFPATGHPGWVMSVAFSPDGGIVAAANNSTTSYYVGPGEVHLYSAETGFPYALLRGHTKRVNSIAFSSDGKLLASASADGSVRLWGVRTLDSESISQPITSKPTPTPTGSPGAAAWRDDFNGSLAEGWYWKNENSTMWNLTETPGFLRIYASPYGVSGQNLLLRSTIQGNFVITTHLLFEPVSNFQLAGLIIFQDEENLLQFGRAFCDVPGNCVGNGIYFDLALEGNSTSNNFATEVNNVDEAYLRLERSGNEVTASFSYEGITWFVIGSHSLPPDFIINGVGLGAGQDEITSDEDIPADFDYFELIESQSAGQGSTGEEVGEDPFLGDWVAVDPHDGSDMKLAISREGIVYKVTFNDQGASICGKDDNGKPMYALEMIFAGTAHGDTIYASSTSATCLSTPASPLQGEYQINISYQPGSDTIWDSLNKATWTRVMN